MHEEAISLDLVTWKSGQIQIQIHARSISRSMSDPDPDSGQHQIHARSVLDLCQIYWGLGTWIPGSAIFLRHPYQLILPNVDCGLWNVDCGLWNVDCSVERMLEYTCLSQEPATVAEGGHAPPPGWPASGSIEYVDVSACYRPGLPLVLRWVGEGGQVWGCEGLGSGEGGAGSEVLG